MSGIIYTVKCCCHPEEGVRYVGQTSKGLASRRYNHFWHARNKDSRSYNGHFYRWIRKHGEENIVFEVLEECPTEELDAREEFWITSYRTLGYKLTNIKQGGAQARGHKRPEQSKKMSGAGNPMYGKDRRDVMEHARSFQNGISAETKALWSKNRKGEGNANAKITEQDVRDIRENYTGSYGEITQLSREYGINTQSVRNIIKFRTWKHVIE